MPILIADPLDARLHGGAIHELITVTLKETPQLAEVATEGRKVAYSGFVFLGKSGRTAKKIWVNRGKTSQVLLLLNDL